MSVPHGKQVAVIVFSRHMLVGQPQSRMGFLGWALGGGICFGSIAGSGFGSVGMALIGAGAFKIWAAMERAPTPEVRANLVALFLVVGITGVVAMGIGYSRYLNSPEGASGAEDRKNSKDHGTGITQDRK